MTIKVSKPEVNVREKLAELDFDRVPFQKMPAGSVLQVVNARTGSSTSSNSSSWTDVGIECELTQLGENSKFLITAGLRTQMVGGTDKSAKFRVLATYNDNSTDEITKSLMINNWSTWNQEAGSLVDIYTPNKVQGTSINFKVQGAAHSTGTSWYMNDTWGVSNVYSTLVIMEVAQ